jgi:CDP-diglyceride synthetase
VDARDAGPVYVTHFTLLLGLATPVWLAVRLPCDAHACQPWWAAGAAAAARHSRAPASCAASSLACCPGTLPAVLAGLSGTVIIGFGDTAASIVGRALGRTPLYIGAHKTVEGTAAGAAAALAGWVAVLAAAPLGAAHAGWSDWRWVVALSAATMGACLLEAVTSQLDNILIPLWFFPHALLSAIA